MKFACTRHSDTRRSSTLILAVAAAWSAGCPTTTPGPAGPATSGPDASVAPDADPLARARESLLAAGIEDPWGLGPEDAARARQAGLDEDVVGGLLERILADCLARDERCYGPSTPDRQEPDEAVEKLVALLGEIGTDASVPLLLRLRERGVFRAGMALERRLARTWAEERLRHPCRPPTAEEVARVREELGDFAVLRPRDDALTAVAPSSSELDDLAYFLAAVADSGEAVGAEGRANRGSWTRPAEPNEEAERLRTEIEAARRAGDLDAVLRAGIEYLERLGYPGPIRGAEEDEYAWGGARYSYVMRDVAQAAELTGRLDLAADLYRRADPGGGVCGTSADSLWQEQVEGLIRAEERRGRCRAVIAERLLAVDGAAGGMHGRPGPTYGTAELAEAGYDVPRLYRGAWATLYRDAEPDELAAALATAPPPLAEAARRRLAARGPEAWDARVLAIEGLADTARAAALPLLLALAESGLGEPRRRAVRALGKLAARPYNDPCLPLLSGHESRGSEWEREIFPLGRECATVLRPEPSADLARRLLPLAESGEPELRAEAVRALGRIASPAVLEALRALTEDDLIDPDQQRCTGDETGERRCAPLRPVAEAAAEAVANIEAIERAWARQAAEAARFGPATAVESIP